MNILDIGILAIVGFCALAGFRKGLIRMVYRLASFFIAIVLAWLLFPHVAGVFRATPMPDVIQTSIKNNLNLDAFIAEQAAERADGVIESLYALPFPDTLVTFLSNSIEAGVTMHIDTIEEHVSAFFAGIAVNAIALVVVFVLVLIGLSVGGFALDIVAKLPVVNSFNNGGGLIAGLFLGIGIVWVLVVTMSMFFVADPYLYELLENSFAAGIILNSVLPQLAETAYSGGNYLVEGISAV